MRNSLKALIAAAAAIMLTPNLANANSGDFSGGVAIGTGYAGINTAPTNGLIVQGNVGFGTESPNMPLMIVPTIGDTGLEVQTVGNTNTGVYVGANTTRGQILVKNNGTNIFNFNGNPAAVSYANVTAGFGIGNTSPSYLLHVGSSSASGIVMQLQNSSGACTYNPGASSVTVSCSSDAKLKSDIVDAPSALPWLGDMRVRDFTVKATGERKTGVIAQEMLTTHPDMVHKNAEGIYLVDEPNPWKVVKAVQEQEARIQEQAAQAQKQQAEIDELKKTIAQLKQKK